MRLVFIASPFKSSAEWTTGENIAYARLCVLDSIKRSEAPFAPHLLYTQEDILDDDDLQDRVKGMDMGKAWLKASDALAVYVDHGISAGMADEIVFAEQEGIKIEQRSLVS